MRNRAMPADWPLMALALTLTAFGIAMVYSAGQTDVPTYVAGLWRSQMVWFALGLGAAYIISRMSVRGVKPTRAQNRADAVSLWPSRTCNAFSPVWLRLTAMACSTSVPMPRPRTDGRMYIFCTNPSVPARSMDQPKLIRT